MSIKYDTALVSMSLNRADVTNEVSVDPNMTEYDQNLHTNKTLFTFEQSEHGFFSFLNDINFYKNKQKNKPR